MPVSMGTHPRHLEELRLGGGYNSSPGGGSDFDQAGNIQSNGDLDIDGSGSFGGDLAVAGDLGVGGLDTTWRTYLSANMGIPDPSLPCGPASATNWRNYQVVTHSLAFDPTSPQAAFFQFRLPKGYDGRPLKFTLEWSATAGTSGDVRWGVNPLSFKDGSSLVQTGPLYYFTDTFISVSAFHEATAVIDALSVDSGGFVTLRVLRDAADALDTFGNPALLMGLALTL
ncbi:MAG: hypothetical protein L3K26_12915 [Candidatus Hydrogenedentes bacterium]|nr:hypothetical protein [Candidatus Hydrogenedentota bacterium]